MATLIMELPPEVYRRLHEEADRLGKPPQIVAQELLVEQLSTRAAASGDDRGRVRQALEAARLLTELSPNLSELADPSVRLEDIQAALGRSGDRMLSEIVLEQRGPRE
jgi:hypothetical protein